MIFIIGTGKVIALSPPKYLYKGRFLKSAAALETASETPKIAFAPRIDLFSLPSNSNIILSISF